MRRAILDSSLDLRVIARRPLLYTAGRDASLDRPAHVRAASGMVAIGGGRFCVVQDDALFLAVIGLSGVAAVPLPAGHEGKRTFDDARGNKAHKLDLEACVAIPAPDGGPPRVWLFGSGSTPARERIVVVTLGDAGADAEGGEANATSVRVVDARALYAAFRGCADFAGSELNVEGAALDGDDVVFASRGNGADDEGRGGGLAPVDATCRVGAAELARYLEDPSRPLVPPLRDVTPFDLGGVDGARLTFTDLASAGGRLFYSACAELSPDAVSDGPVVGVAIGALGDAREPPRYGLVRDERGALLTDKIEGLVAREGGWLAVVDVDDPDRPAELLELSR